jgi:hypothetical protein
MESAAHPLREAIKVLAFDASVAIKKCGAAPIFRNNDQ